MITADDLLSSGLLTDEAAQALRTLQEMQKLSPLEKKDPVVPVAPVAPPKSHPTVSASIPAPAIQPNPTSNPEKLEMEPYNFNVENNTNPLFLYPNTCASIAESVLRTSLKRKSSSEKPSEPGIKCPKQDFVPPPALNSFLNFIPLENFPGTEIKNYLPMASFCVQTLLAALSDYDKYQQYRVEGEKTYLDHMIEAHFQYVDKMGSIPSAPGCAPASASAPAPSKVPAPAPAPNSMFILISASDNSQ